MAESIPVLTVEKGDGDWLIVTFSDGTTAGYVAEELLKLRPHRELTREGREEFSLANLLVRIDSVRQRDLCLGTLILVCANNGR